MLTFLGYRVDPEAGLVYGSRGRPIGSADSSGYLQVDGRSRGLGMLAAHRLVWCAVHGEIPHGFEINHINGMKRDNRIANLELVDRSGNIRHAYATGLKTNRGEKHPMHRLTESDVREIRLLHRAGLVSREIALLFGVGSRCVRDVTSGRTWSHVTDEAVA